MNEERKMLQQIMGQYGPPAFMRRANDVQAAWEALVENCLAKREEMLRMVKLALGTLKSLAGNWSALRKIGVDEDTVLALQKLHDELQPELRFPAATTNSVRRLRRAWLETEEAIRYFNRRWVQYLRDVELENINKLRDGFNRYYIIEKECALGSPRLARLGFQKLPPATWEELLKRMPPIPEVLLGS